MKATSLAIRAMALSSTASGWCWVKGSRSWGEKSCWRARSTGHWSLQALWRGTAPANPSLCHSQTFKMFCSSRRPEAPALPTSTCSRLSRASRVCEEGRGWGALPCSVPLAGEGRPHPVVPEHGAAGSPEPSPCIPRSRETRPGRCGPRGQGGGRRCRGRRAGGRSSCPAAAAPLCCKGREGRGVGRPLRGTLCPTRGPRPGPRPPWRPSPRWPRYLMAAMASMALCRTSVPRRSVGSSCSSAWRAQRDGTGQCPLASPSSKCPLPAPPPEPAPGSWGSPVAPAALQREGPCPAPSHRVLPAGQGVPSPQCPAPPPAGRNTPRPRWCGPRGQLCRRRRRRPETSASAPLAEPRRGETSERIRGARQSPSGHGRGRGRPGEASSRGTKSDRYLRSAAAAGADEAQGVLFLLPHHGRGRRAHGRARGRLQWLHLSVLTGLRPGPGGRGGPGLLQPGHSGAAGGSPGHPARSGQG